jgi:predicted RNase H-like nuclease
VRRFVGIDLASTPERTGVALVTVSGPREDRRARASIVAPDFVADDTHLIELVSGDDVVGLDAPLGWPDDFVAAIAAHHALASWPVVRDETAPPRESLRLRRTDRFVRDLQLGSTPLSVSSDLIGVVAMRAALLQSAWWGGCEPRDGSGRLIETYPAAALRQWGFLAKRGIRYKGGPKESREREVEQRRAMIAALRAKGASWLSVDDDLCAGALSSDHIFDALICAVVALAATARLTACPRTPVERDAARREGWIHVPTGSFDDLVEATQTL